MSIQSKPSQITPKHKVQRDCNTQISESTRRILADFHLEDIASHLLRRAHFAAEEMFAQEFAKESITPRQKAALVVLYKNPGISQNVLADKLFMDRNTVAEMVKRMTASGLMTRRTSPNDQRAYQLFLADEGAAMLDRVMPRDLILEQNILEKLPAEYRPLFLKCLRLIIDQPTGNDESITNPESSAVKAPMKRNGTNP